MNLIADTLDSGAARPLARKRSDFVALASGLLPPFDMVSLLFAGYFSTAIYAAWFAPAGFDPGAWSDHKSTALVAAAVLAAVSLYDKGFAGDASRGQAAAPVRRYVTGLLMFASAALVIAYASRALDVLPREWVATWFGTSLMLTALARVLLWRKIRLLEHKGVLTEVIAVVGAGPLADRLIRHLHQTRGGRIEILGVFDDAPGGTGEGTTQPVRAIAELIELGKTRQIDWILLTLPCMIEEPLLSIVHRLKALGAPIGLCPQNFGLKLPYRTIDYVGDGVPVTLLADRPIRRWNAVLKSLEDLVLGGVITLLLLPILGMVAVAIRIDSPGPIIFRQRRHTYNNREFDVYKFRTMRWAPPAAAEDLRQTARGDSRITRVGRLLRASSIDELPQLFNVLQGDMSLVGPRPHAVNMRTEDQLGCEITDAYPHRHRVKPGMTGWSQVNGCRGATDTTAQLRRRVDLDLRYVENWSLRFDLKILALTIPEVLKRTNAY